jgi:hypothetical protein
MRKIVLRTGPAEPPPEAKKLLIRPLPRTQEPAATERPAVNLRPASAAERPAARTPTPTPSSARRQPPARRANPQPHNSSRLPLFLAIGAAAAVILIIALAASASHRPPSVPRARTTPASDETSDPAAPMRPTRFEELGGKTMAEWMAENNKNNPLLQERKQRMHQSGAGGNR